MLPKVCRMNHKNLVFALLKTIQKKLGAILDVFCDSLTTMIGCFLLLRANVAEGPDDHVPLCSWVAGMEQSRVRLRAGRCAPERAGGGALKVTGG